jgi:transposase
MSSLTDNVILISLSPMKCVVELTEAETKTLQQLSRKHPHQDFRARGLGLLELARGRRLNEIAVEFEVSDKSVYNWAHARNDKGLCGLLVGHKSGRPRALSVAMIATAVEAANAESMTLKQIAQRIEQVRGTPFTCRLC